MASHIERRKFLATLGGAATAWPLAVRAQQSARSLSPRCGEVQPANHSVADVSVKKFRVPVLRAKESSTAQESDPDQKSLVSVFTRSFKPWGHLGLEVSHHSQRLTCEAILTCGAPSGSCG